MKLLIGSKNKNKIEEIKDILHDLDVEILSALDFTELPDVIEDKPTIKGNAKKKALENAAKMGMLVIADDTGLFVDALDGRPGVYSARYSGEDCSYKDNRDKMLDEMQGKTDRKAHFATVVALASPNEIIAAVRGEVHGTITEAEFGEGGFGYDPIFRADETGETFGEMSSEAKHEISHRARALKKIVPLLKEYLEEMAEEE